MSAQADVPLDFLQNKVPKLLADGLEPAEWPDDPALEWAPPGHGDLYTALVTSGLLDELLERDYRHAFVSNADKNCTWSILALSMRTSEFIADERKRGTL